MNPGGVESGEGQGAVQEGGDMCVYLWLIHVDVWQKPTQYCKAIILQLKINLKRAVIFSYLSLDDNFNYFNYQIATALFDFILFLSGKERFFISNVVHLVLKLQVMAFTREET